MRRVERPAGVRVGCGKPHAFMQTLEWGLVGMKESTSKGMRWFPDHRAGRVCVRAGTTLAGDRQDQGSVERGGRLQRERDRPFHGVRLGIHSSDSSRGWEGWFHPRGG